MKPEELLDAWKEIHRAEEMGYHAGKRAGFFRGLLWGMAGSAILILVLTEALWTVR